jgi:transcriptional regulator with XRE-family HTH domain
MTFGKKLKELRQQRGMTQTQLAEACDIPYGTVRDYEQDKRNPLLANAQILARVLGVSLDVFPAPSETAGRSSGKRPRGRPRKSPPTTPPAEDLEATAKKTRRRPRKEK